MKKIVAAFICIALIFSFSACAKEAENEKTTVNTTEKTTQSTTKESLRKDEEMKVKIEINGKTFFATLEDNEAAKELFEIIKNDGLTLELSDYSGFEKVGSLGHTLTSNDKQTTTKSGDIVLYQSNQIVMFYGSNSWNYTRLGRIDNLDGREEALGNGNITVSFS